MRLVLALLLVPAVASAGRLGEVVDDLNHATNDCCKSSGSSSGSSDSDGSSSSADWSDHHGYGTSPSLYTGPNPFFTPYWGTSYGKGVSMLGFLGGESVVGSDAALNLDLRTAYKGFGVGVRGTVFFEQQSPEETLTLSTWAFSVAGRVIQDGRSSLWLEGGASVMNTEPDLSLAGVHGGVRLDRQLAGLVSAEGGLRYHYLQDGIRLIETNVALRLSILQVGYRYTRFNVGPSLHGPEIGIALWF
jgi:hypothetical protein